MAKEVRIRRGSESANNLYTGPAGEVTVDTDNWNLRLHDGSTEGGHLIGSVSELINTFQELSEKGAVNGYAGLDSNGKIPEGQLPALSIVNIETVADIAARDALTLEQGDIAIVTDAIGDPDVSIGSATYIYTGTEWKRLQFPEDAVAIHGIPITAAAPSDGEVLYYDIATGEFKYGASSASSIQGIDVTSTSPTDGQVLVYDSSSGDFVYGASGLNWEVYTSNSTISTNNGVIADTSSGPFTITLDTPSVGDVVGFTDFDNTWSTNNLTIYSSDLIEGSNTLYADTDGGYFYVIYNGNEWKVRL